MKQFSWFSAVGFALFCLLWSTAANAKTLYVAKNGSDKSNSCATASSPCLTIANGISHMASGDTLTIGDGTYAEQIVRMPDGTASAYTTIQATNDWGVTIDGSGFTDTFLDGIRISGKYVAIRGFHVKMNQAHPNNLGIDVFSSSHVKVQRCSVSYSGTTGNVAGINVGPAADYTLVEESYVYGGARYPFLVYQSTHTVVRRCVSRVDYWNGSLQAANFTNYNGDMTVWENNIAIDSDTASTGSSSGLYGGFFNENKVPDSSWSGTATRETHRGNIVLNINAKYSGIYDYDISNLHTYSDDIVWDSHGGYYADYIHGDAPVLNASNLTIGKILGAFDAPDGQGSAGTGFYVGPGASGTMIKDTVTDSIFWENPSFGIAANVTGDYNSYWGNGANYGGTPKPAPGAHDLTSDLSAGLKYLPRVEAGSMLATAGSGGGQVGASVVLEWGTTGTLWGDPGYDTITADPLWPFPNEDVIKADMASYTGPGAAGARGFTTGNSKDGTPQTLTKYIWEYLGNQIPPDVYGFHIVTGTLPTGTVGVAYQAMLQASGGTTPYKWSMTGTLPPGLTFDGTAGTISGTPTMAVTETLGLTATDSASPALTTTVSAQLQILPAVQAMADAGAGGDDAGEVASGGDGGVKAQSKMSSGGGGGGCSCRTASRGSAPLGLGALCGATGLFLLRRRRAVKQAPPRSR